MATKTPEEVYQEVRKNGLFPLSLLLDPETVASMWVNNVFRRSLSLNTALSDNGEVLLRATTTGELKVAGTGAGFTTYGVATGTAPDAFNATDQLVTVGSTRWDILVEDNDAVIQVRNAPETAYLGEIILPVGGYSLEVSSTIVQIRNRIAGAVSTWQIVGWS